MNYLKSKNFNIYCLQDTHFTEQDELNIKNQWKGECLFNSFTSNQRGVAIFFNENFDLQIHKVKKDEGGNLLGLDITIEEQRITLVNIYGPNVDTPCFYQKVADIIEEFDNQSCILCGDFNLIQSFNLDTHNYVNINNPKSREKVLQLMEDFNLVDPFRELYPNLKRFTWRKKKPFKQSRLDFFLISDNIFHFVNDVKIDNSYRSDHSPVVFSFKINEFIKGRGLWKFNNSLLHDTDYVKEIKNLISIVKEQYAVKIYRDENLQNIDNSEIEFTVDDQLFFETLLTEIRSDKLYASLSHLHN